MAKEAYCRAEEFPEGEGCFLIAWSLEEWRGTSEGLSLLNHGQGQLCPDHQAQVHMPTLGMVSATAPQAVSQVSCRANLSGMESRATREGSHTPDSWSQGWEEGSEPHL